MAEATYDGMPLSEVPINHVDWTPAAARHIATRSARYGRPEFDIDPRWATEAALEPNRQVRLGRSKSGESIAVLGLSLAAPAAKPGHRGRVLKVWLVPKAHPPDGRWWGASACAADRSEQRKYWEK